MTDSGADAAEEIRSDMAVLAQLERRAFASFNGSAFPTGSAIAFEAQKWGYSLGQDLGEHLDLALRRAVFLHSHDITDRVQLIDVAKTEGLDAGGLSTILDDGRFRAAVSADVEAGRLAGVSETPRLDVGDGTSYVNPGITTSRVRGISIIEADHPVVYEEIIHAAAMSD